MSIPFKLTARAREANASPSVYLEKGSYRMRAPKTRPVLEPIVLQTHPRSRSVSSDRNSMYLTILVLLLALACVASFGAAYYLFTTRLGALSLADRISTNARAQVIQINSTMETCPRVPSDSQEKFLAYLPHSGFHNQRIALENALTLSYMMNRTLIVPPVRLGDKPIRYVNYDALHSFVALSGKEHLQHCSKLSVNAALPPECYDYFDYTLLSWEWLVDFTNIKTRQRLLFRWNMTDAWIYECLGISNSDVRTLKDISRYHFQFLDITGDTSITSDKYMESLHISMLASTEEPLLQVGTLFGSSRLHLKTTEGLVARKQSRESLVFDNSFLLDIADAVGESIGGPYLAAHVRLGDGKFLTRGEEKARLTWWSLVHHTLAYSVEDTLTLEQTFAPYFTSSPPVSRLYPKWTSRIRREPLDTRTISPSNCRGALHAPDHLQPLNMPLYIATDVKNPESDPVLALFFNTFPCIFHLGRFSQHLTTLDQLENSYDGLKLKPFLLPFLDAIIVGKAWHAVGTPGSTFSTYVTDVLWSKYNGFAIKERG